MKIGVLRIEKVRQKWEGKNDGTILREAEMPS